MYRYKPIIIVSMAALIVSMAACNAHGHSDERDGNFWRSLDRKAKMTFVVGFFDGIKLGANMSAWKSDISQPTAADAARTSYKEYFGKYVSNTTNIQVVDGLDEFYSAEENRGN